MSKIVYHGSPKGDIEELVASYSTHQKKCIYATDNKVIAMMFMGRGNGDLDTIKNMNNGIPMIVERRPGVLKKLYDKEGYLYEIDGSTFNHYDYLWSAEVISFEEKIKPLNKVHYDNVLDKLKEEAKNNNLILYEYPKRPDNIPLDNSDLIDKYIGFYNQGIDSALDQLLKVYPEFREQVDDKMSKGKTK